MGSVGDAKGKECPITAWYPEQHPRGELSRQALSIPSHLLPQTGIAEDGTTAVSEFKNPTGVSPSKKCREPPGCVAGDGWGTVATN